MRFWATVRVYVVAAAVTVQLVISLVLSGQLFYRRVRFLEAMERAGEDQRNAYLFGRGYANLIFECRKVIRPGERVLLRTDGEPWILNYYLYPIELYEETVAPPSDNRLYRESARQRAYPRRTDIPVDWVIDDAAGPEGRQQQLSRVGDHPGSRQK